MQEVYGELSDFAAAVRDVPELRNVLRNPELDPATKALVSDAPEELPSWLESLTLAGVRAFEGSWDVRLENGHIEVEESA